MLDKKRVVDLNKILRAFSADRIGSDEISDILFTTSHDNLHVEHDQINYLLDTANEGSSNETSVSTNSTERNDLHDSDRTVILRKLSNQISIDEVNNNNNEIQTDVNQLTYEDICVNERNKTCTRTT
ncbi:unnamed protein product [Rotaria sordida]|uniref:Uncharacterized protein n=1 Tax=Rotaria sordida TaxID=392033 RepID=A0A814UWC5_9BILA|nr:unnamed protein product [Rotaria sordida]